MKRSYVGVAIVGAVLVASALLNDRSSVIFVGVAGALAYGAYAATAAFALVAYRHDRDPAFLLAGTGAAAVTAHHVVVALLFALIGRRAGSAWPSLVGFAPIVGHLALMGTLAALTPWKDRRGRPPLDPLRVAGVVGGGILLTDLVIVLFKPTAPSVAAVVAGGLSIVGLLCGIALLTGGAVIAVRALPHSGREGWVAAAGLAIAVLGLTIVVAPLPDRGGALRILLTWQALAPTLAAAMLTVFVLSSTQVQTSRMRRATDRAAEVMEGRAEIASTIAHDVRGPVGTIKGLATTTRKSYDRLGDAERLEFIGMIEEESARLMRLTDQVAMALKVDAGSLDLNPRRQTLEPLLRQAIDAVAEHGRPIDVRGPRGLEVPADTRWVVEAVRQGLDNAIGFSPPGAPVRIDVEAGTDAVVTIGDEGPGIPPEMREALFEKFSRWRPAGYEERQGSGLGLFIVRGIARAHGGDATLDAAPGGGTMLRIRLPREEMGK